MTGQDFDAIISAKKFGLNLEDQMGTIVGAVPDTDMATWFKLETL